MTITPLETDAVVGGIDTHQDLHWAAVVDHTGHVLGTEAFSTTRSGYRAMLVWLRSKGDVCRVGVESTGQLWCGHLPAIWPWRVSPCSRSRVLIGFFGGS